eukprot:COSAG06_NODE_49149_length_327_cov_0.907895_1_plen_28_part_01
MGGRFGWPLLWGGDGEGSVHVPVLRASG